MAHRDIIINSKKVGPHKSYICPRFNEKTILVESHFEFIEMWLQRNGNEESRIYWSQAKNFYQAALNTEVTSKPLIAYYCMLNAAKSLLSQKGITVSHYHGITGEPLNTKAVLKNEGINVKSDGVFVGLSKYFGASLEGKSVNLKEVLYNIPFIHRAFTTTHPSMKDLFIQSMTLILLKVNEMMKAGFVLKYEIVNMQKQRFLISKEGGSWTKQRINSLFIEKEGFNGK